MLNNNMNNLNQVTEYIEENITEDIKVKDLAGLINIDEFTLQKIFYFLTGITIVTYIRNRRLTRAGIEIQNDSTKVLDIAIKYGYESSEAFARSFKKMQGINPSQMRKTNTFLKGFPVIKFDSKHNIDEELSFKIESHEQLVLYGKYIETEIQNIKIEAPKFWEEISNDKTYKAISPKVSFGVIEYDSKFPLPEKAKYYIATKEEVIGWDKIVIPKSEWVIFKIENRSGEYMSNFSKKVYEDWIPYSGYNIRNAPELEVYGEDYTEWWLPINKKSTFFE
jgi:AraC family transcriptional regulator